VNKLKKRKRKKKLKWDGPVHDPHRPGRAHESAAQL